MVQFGIKAEYRNGVVLEIRRSEKRRLLPEMRCSTQARLEPFFAAEIDIHYDGSQYRSTDRKFEHGVVT